MAELNPLPESLPHFTKERGKEEEGKKTLYRNVCRESVIQVQNRQKFQNGLVHAVRKYDLVNFISN
jgi:hypothetical protein